MLNLDFLLSTLTPHMGKHMLHNSSISNQSFSNTVKGQQVRRRTRKSKSKTKESHTVISDEIRATLVDHVVISSASYGRCKCRYTVAVEAFQDWIRHARQCFAPFTVWPGRTSPAMLMRSFGQTKTEDRKQPDFLFLCSICRRLIFFFLLFVLCEQHLKIQLWFWDFRIKQIPFLYLCVLYLSMKT